MSSPLVVVPQRLRDLSHAIDDRRAELAGRTPAGALDSIAAALAGSRVSRSCQIAAHNVLVVQQIAETVLGDMSDRVAADAASFGNAEADNTVMITTAGAGR